jgi:hypothetical protein
MAKTSPSKLLDQFVIRMPDGLRDRLAEEAAINQRSMNAEIVHRLVSSLEWSSVARLRKALENINLSKLYDPIKPSQIAEAIGETSASPIERVFAGSVEPNFTQLDKMASFLRVRPDWLKHGNGHPYEVGEIRFYGPELVDHVFNLGAERVYLIRSRHKNGHLAIVLKLNKLDFLTFRTTLQLSYDAYGVGGRRELAHFSNACCAFWKHQGANVAGMLLHEDDFEDLIGGEMYPGTTISKAGHSNWFADWWDQSMFTRPDGPQYWPKFREFCEAIQWTIEEDDKLRAERDACLAQRPSV